MEQKREQRINPQIYDEMIFDDCAKNTQWGKDRGLFNQCFWENWIFICRKMKLDLYITPYTILNSKWIKYLNVRLETLKLLEENIGKNLLNIGLGNYFSHMTSESQTTKANIDK